MTVPTPTQAKPRVVSSRESELQLVALVLEDEPTQLRVTKQTLRRHSFDVLAANDADEAVALVVTRGIDLVVLDVALGTGRESEGLIACERIRKARRSTYIAFLTSNNTKATQRVAKRFGAHIVEKSANRIADISLLLDAYFTSWDLRIAAARSATDISAVRSGSPPGGAEGHRARPADLASRDLDYEEYLRLSLDPTWVAANSGKTAAFSDGQWIGSFVTEQEAVGALRRLPQDSTKFFITVGAPLRTLEFSNLEDEDLWIE